MHNFIPKTYIGITSYISRCDYIFNQGFKEYSYPNNKLSDITSNSTVYCWSSHLNHLFDYLSKTDLTNITLISGCEDHPTNPNGTVIGLPIRPVYAISPCPKNIVKWYAQNAEICSDFMKPAPIGLCLFPLKSETVKNYKISCDRNKLLFININPNTNPTQRNFILFNIMKQCPSATLQEYGDIQLYCKNMQMHKFCICPPGNGKDTHRAWEALSFGCIPIVEKSNMNDFYATLFPFLVVDRWCDITEDFLHIKYNEIKNKTYRYDLLDVDNWFNYFNIKISNKHKDFQDLIETLNNGTSPDYSKNILYY
jgi:hypothetical protein